ncbi:uncharacterized protein buc2l [Misgurnus anguillicaudatus]|uniref:uncharacterized protein buc2l n=1 Tax=Misgurnus anguillicaudatus TaxID=75329 RepID=UPI003CCF9F25
MAAQESTRGLSDLHSQAPRHTVPPTSRVLQHDEQFQRHQPFYFPNPQPVLPQQWPLSAPYMPYTGLGYGMVMPPPILFPPCLEVPGYMFPHAPLNMLDYRRVTNPITAPNIALQAHRFRFHNAVPANRVMVNSEVQTEPLGRSSTQNSNAGSESGRGTGCDSPISVSASFSENKSVACPEHTPVFTRNRVVATNTINTSGRSAVHKSEILLQTERVQMKFSETPRFKFVGGNENSELASQDAGDLLQSSLGSIRSEDVVSCSYQSLAFRKEKQGVKARNLRYSKHCLPPCKEMAKVRMSPSCGAFESCPKPSRSNVAESFEAHRSSKFQRASDSSKGKPDGNSSHNVCFKILRLPFDMQTCRLEASIWSVESLMPYVPSREQLVKNGLVTPQKSPQKALQLPFDPQTCQLEASIWSVESLMPYVPSREHLIKNGLVTPQKSPQKDLGHPFDTQKCQLEASIWSVESLMPYVPSREHLIKNGLVTPQKSPQKDLRLPFDTQTCQLEASVWSVESLMPYVPSKEELIKNGLVTPQKSQHDAVPVGDNLHICRSSRPRSRNSSICRESRTPYRPSTSWLADFGNVYYYSKLPALKQKLFSPEKKRHKSALESPLPEGKQAIGPELALLGHKMKMMNQRPEVRIGTSDHIHSCKSTAAHCSPRRLAPGVRSDWVSHFSLEEKISRYSCKNETRGKDHHKVSDTLCCRREEDAVVKTFDKHKAKQDVMRAHDTQKRILGNHLAKYHQARLGEQPDLCENCRCLHASSAFNRCDECGRGVCEQIEGDHCASLRLREPPQRPQKGTREKEERTLSTNAQRTRPMNDVKAH